MKEKYQVILFDDEEDKEIYNFYNEKEAIDYAKSFARKYKMSVCSSTSPNVIVQYALKNGSLVICGVGVIKV
jgi:hypothetical protein